MKYPGKNATKPEMVHTICSTKMGRMYGLKMEQLNPHVTRVSFRIRVRVRVSFGVTVHVGGYR